MRLRNEHRQSRISEVIQLRWDKGRRSRNCPLTFHPQFGFAIRGNYQTHAFCRVVAQAIWRLGGYDDINNCFLSVFTRIALLPWDDCLTPHCAGQGFVHDRGIGQDTGPVLHAEDTLVDQHGETVEGLATSCSGIPE